MFFLSVAVKNKAAAAAAAAEKEMKVLSRGSYILFGLE
jgi:hypothetical protein